MATSVKKYNPGFLSDDEIIDSFCVRTNEFESIVESLRESTGNSNPHTIVIGPRGIGKTHLLVRVAAQVRRDESLDAFFPIVFPEESYEISTVGEFWLECLYHLAQQAPVDEQSSLNLSYNDLRNETKDGDLAERCIGALLDFADRQRKRLLLVVENLNMLFDDINDPEVGWQLRKTLQTERRIMLLGSATNSFDEIANSERAMYDLFRVIMLRPLTTDECLALWEAVADSSTTFENVRPLEILTGGNPRLIAIIARFGSGRTFQELMDNLLDLVDDHTEYFKSHLEHLPPQERRVYLALARLWKPATTKEVADLARVSTNQCSSLLKRLTERGAVAIEGGTPRRRQFYLTERLYNIYYLLRRGGGTQPVVQALIDFMTAWYSPMDLWDIVERTYLNARFRNAPPPDIFLPIAVASFDAAHALFDQGAEQEALAIFSRIAKSAQTIDSPEAQIPQLFALDSMASLLNLMNRNEDAIVQTDLLLQLCDVQHGGVPRTTTEFLRASALKSKGIALAALDNADSAAENFRQAITAFETLEPSQYATVEIDTATLGRALALWRTGETLQATSALNLIIEKYGTDSKRPVQERVADAIGLKVQLLSEIGQTIDDDDLMLLLELTAHIGLREPTTMALIRYVDQVGAASTLKKIQQSEATEALLPLVTALQQEIGQTPRVATEVQEVANDIRKQLALGSASVEAPPSAPISSNPSS